MLQRPAKVRATFPRTHWGDRITHGWAKRKPCFGGGEPVLRWAKKAFSAPSTCTVLEGNFAKRSRPPAPTQRRAASMGPIRVLRLGRCVSARV